VQHLHAHFGTNAAAVAMLTHSLGGPPWSFTVHGPEEFDKPQFIGMAEKIQRCAFVVAISSYARSQLYRLIEHHHWPKIHVVHCGLEESFFKSPLTVKPNPGRFVCVGRLCEQKGQLLLLTAIQQLASRGVPIELVLVGDGEMRAEIEAFITAKQLEGRVRITGHVSTEQLHREILTARALVLPSFAEGLPMVIMEAMALQRPVISTFVAGIPELVRDGQHGWLVPAGDVAALAKAIEECLATPESALSSMGTAALDRVRRRHSVEIQARELRRLFRAAIDQKTRQAG
jgi:glycosyltransferase involved in cell wall biosynthesis